MGEAIGQILPLALGVGLSPIPIVAVVLMLVSSRGRTNGPLFALGWVVGLSALGAIVLSLAAAGSASDEGDPATWVSVLKLVLGLALLAVAWRQWRGRPRAGEAERMPKWMGALDDLSPAKAAGIGAFLAAVNPKNLLLAVAAAAAIAQTGIPAGEQAVAYAVFVLIGTLGVGTCVVLALVLGERAREPLDRLRVWMGANNAVIMAVILLLLGAKLVGDAIAGF